MGIAKTVVCHPKDFGWFVSDVVPADFDSLFQLLKDESITETPQQLEDLKFLTDRWLQFYNSGRIQVRSDPFWTTAHPFWRLPKYASDLYKALQKSDLVIYKGDLNYRKLVEDVMPLLVITNSRRGGPEQQNSLMHSLQLEKEVD